MGRPGGPRWNAGLDVSISIASDNNCKFQIRVNIFYSMDMLDTRTFVLLLSPCMSIWDRLLYLIGLRPTPGPRTYHFDASESLRVTLSTLSSDEGRPEHELIPDILAAGLTQYTANERLWDKWNSLSPRERDVAAFVCLGYTNRQIAARLNIAPDTVKDRLSSVFRKFDINRRNDLRALFSDWDFSEWERQR